MPKIIAMTTGDDTELTLPLTKENLPFVIPTSADVQVSIVSKNRLTILVPPVTAVATLPGANWDNSIVKVILPSTATALIPDNQLNSAVVEVQVDDGKKTTWFSRIKIYKGTIGQ